MARFSRIALIASLSLLFVDPWPPAVAAAETAPETTWQHPVEAPIVDYFRPPSGPYGAGNRGLEYGTRPGQLVVAVADGVVTFAGSVGRNRFVVVAHSPELRSTYAYLDGIDVSVGDNVSGGQRIATAAHHFHLTARLRNVYVDPFRYLTSSWSVRLIAGRPGRRSIG